MTRSILTQSDVANALAMVAPAEAAFSSRWRRSTLARIDRELNDLLEEQLDLFNSSLIGDDKAEITEQAEATIRGWAAACRAMEAEHHDAYLAGIDWATKTQVVISDSKQSVEHVRAHPECRLIAFTPDEIAKLIGQQAMVAATKAAFADAEVIDLVAATERSKAA